MTANEIVKALNNIDKHLSWDGRKHTVKTGQSKALILICTTAADTIEAQQTTIEQLQHELEAAKRDMFGTCERCKHGYRQTNIPCADRTDRKKDNQGFWICDFEWRGVCANEGENV